MTRDETIKFIELCSNAANPWPKTDDRFWIFELGYTRALLASLIKEDPVLQHKIKKHSIEQERKKRKA